MQDLGKITIDVREIEGTGGQAAAGGGENLLSTGQIARGLPGMIGQIMKNGLNFSKTSDMVTEALGSAGTKMGGTLIRVGAALGVAAVGIAAAIVAVKAVVNALVKLHEFVMRFAEDIRQFSPSIQLADMQNEIASTLMKFRMGLVVGPAIGAQLQQAGRIERAIFQIRGYAAGIGAAFLEPMTRMLADVLDNLVAYLPKIVEMLAGSLRVIGEVLMKSGQAMFGFASPMATGIGAGLFALGATALKISNTLNEIARNTKASADYSGLNQPFLDDLRLMGARI
jgi:hypothetical protein